MTNVYRVKLASGEEVIAADKNPKRRRKIYIVFFENEISGVYLDKKAAEREKERGEEHYEGHGWSIEEFVDGEGELSGAG